MDTQAKLMEAMASGYKLIRAAEQVHGELNKVNQVITFLENKLKQEQAEVKETDANKADAA